MSKKEPTTQEMIEDFKQYVDVKLSKQSHEIREEITEFRTEMRQGFTGVAEAVQGNQDQLDDHERRIASLEAA
jgi:hypothetical protein